MPWASETPEFRLRGFVIPEGAGRPRGVGWSAAVSLRRAEHAYYLQYKNDKKTFVEQW